MNLEIELDPSRMGDYLRCPRLYFYRHVLGWRTETSQLPLVFGESWHRAKELLFVRGVKEENVEEAHRRFMDYYREHFSEDTDLDSPRSPGNALTGLHEYVSLYGDWVTLERIGDRPATEVYGTVPISDTRILHFRIDAILRSGSRVLIVDHKTSGINSPTYQSIYSVSNQVYTYLHAMMSLYGVEKVEGLLIDLSVFKKSGNVHVRIPIKKSIEAMEEWLWNANKVYSRIEEDYEDLSKSSPEDPIMRAFPKNERGCAAFGRKCEYYDFCMGWPNPLRRAEKPPFGFVLDFWNPADIEKEKENVISL